MEIEGTSEAIEKNIPIAKPAVPMRELPVLEGCGA